MRLTENLSIYSKRRTSNAPIQMSDFKKRQLIHTLAHYGARSARLNRKQQMKLRTWVLPYLLNELELGNQGPMKIEDMRMFVDQWEHPDLNSEEYRHYYIIK